MIQTNTESEIVYGLVRPGGLLYRRPDSDAPNDRTRIWEVAGATHGDADIVGEPGGSPNWASWELLGIPLFPAPGTQFFVTCDHSFNGAPNRFPFKYIANAAFDGLIRWISGGKPPPHAPFISLDPTELQGIARDTFGNAIGGVRTPYLDVPIATYAEDNPQPACALNGFTLPFADSTLDGLYADHGQYEGLVDHETKTLLKDNWFVLADADTVMQDATYALVP